MPSFVPFVTNLKHRPDYLLQNSKNPSGGSLLELMFSGFRESFFFQQKLVEPHKYLIMK